MQEHRDRPTPTLAPIAGRSTMMSSACESGRPTAATRCRPRREPIGSSVRAPSPGCAWRTKRAVFLDATPAYRDGMTSGCSTTSVARTALWSTALNAMRSCLSRGSRSCWVGSFSSRKAVDWSRCVRSWNASLAGRASRRVRSISRCTVRNAATRQTALVLCGVGDLVAIARGLHRHALGAERPFIVCDPRRQQTDENVRAAENYRTGAEALEAARTGALCVWNRSLPPDFTSVTDLLKDPDICVQLIVCARRMPLRRRGSGYPDRDSVAGRAHPRAGQDCRGIRLRRHRGAWRASQLQFLREDRDWVMENAAGLLPKIQQGRRSGCSRSGRRRAT